MGFSKYEILEQLSEDGEGMSCGDMKGEFKSLDFGMSSSKAVEIKVRELKNNHTCVGFLGLIKQNKPTLGITLNGLER